MWPFVMELFTEHDVLQADAHCGVTSVRLSNIPARSHSTCCLCISGNIGSCPLWDVMDCTTVNGLAHIFTWMCIFISLGYTPKVWLLALMVLPCLTLEELPHAIFQSCWVPSPFPQLFHPPPPPTHTHWLLSRSSWPD